MPLAGALVGLLVTVLIGQEGIAWQPAVHVQGVFDVGGPMPDGRLVVAGSKGLFLLDSDGGAAPYAPDYQGQGAGEAYIAVSQPQGRGSECQFPAGEVYVLDVGRPAGVLRIDRHQQLHRLASIAGVDSLNGIAFDTVGRFGWRLLVTGPHGKSTVVVALDCRGNQARITESAPVLEGGLAVAPAGFGAFAGDLVAPDELSGRLVAIEPDGRSSIIAVSGVPTGQDTGVEGVAFVPPGFADGGRAYFADRATSGSANPGSDTLLALGASQLVSAGVREGDLLAATEGGVRLVDVRCIPTCQARTLLGTASPAHGEGHLLLVAAHPRAAPGSLPGAMNCPAPAPWLPVGIALLTVVMLIVVVSQLWRRRLWRRPPGTHDGR